MAAALLPASETRERGNYNEPKPGCAQRFDEMTEIGRIREADGFPERQLWIGQARRAPGQTHVNFSNSI
jgi:hypothetical protein